MGGNGNGLLYRQLYSEILLLFSKFRRYIVFL